MDRKHCGKRRICLLRAISPFLTVFSKDLYCRHVKTRACVGKGSGPPKHQMNVLSVATCATLQASGGTSNWREDKHGFSFRK